MTKREAIVLLGLAALYLLLNPYWWIDALIYARDIALGPGPVDPGHLIWRPAGWLLYQPVAAIAPNVDPLILLRVLSALGAGWLCVATYQLCRACGLAGSAATVAGAIVAVSQFQWAWGGSGSSYPVAAAAATASLAAMLRGWPEVFPVGRAGVADPAPGAAAAERAVLGRAAALFLVAWATWAVAALILPALVIAAFLRAAGSRARRVRVALGFGTGVGLAILIVLLATYVVAVPSAQQTGFVSWVYGAGHGIPARFSVMSVARAGYGGLIMFLHLGDLGRAVKAAMLGESSFDAASQILLGMAGAIVLGAAALVAALGWVRRLRESAVDRALALVVLAAVAPIAAFAMIWQGSDIERSSPVIGLLAFALVYGLARIPRSADVARPQDRRLSSWLRRSGALRFAWAAALALLVLNVSVFVAPRRFGDAAMTWQLGRVAREHMPERSVIIMTGQELWGAPETSTKYFYDIWAYSIHYNVSVYGENVWRGAVCRLVHAALDSNARVAVLSDFLGAPTPGGIGLIESEYPRPTLGEVGSMFADWNETDRWRVGRFEFVTVEPSAGARLCVVPPAERDLPLPGLQRPPRR